MYSIAMYIVEVLPIMKSMRAQSLSYFSSTKLEKGSLIKIPIRNKQTNAIVLKSESIENFKSEIKSANFQLKKISGIKSKPFLEDEYLDAVEETSKYFCSTSGAVLEKLLPSYLIKHTSLLSEKKYKKDSDGIKKQAMILQANEEERFIYYKSLIREEFAKQKSVFICVPQQIYIERLLKELKRGIDDYTFVFSSSIGEKELKENWHKATKSKHPVLIIATAKWIFIPRNDIETIILEKENESGWKTISRPYIDFRFFIEKYARLKHKDCILGDTILSTETLERYKDNELTEWKSVKWRISHDQVVEIADTKELVKNQKEYRALSPSIKKLIDETSLHNNHLCIFVARRGLASVTVCRDCGEQVACINCESPMILYKTKSGGLFRCHQCGETRDSTEVCKKCKSWRLSSFGIGVERVLEELKQLSLSIPVFELHKEVVSSHKDALKQIEKFYSEPRAILVGTEMMFPYLYKKINFSVIASFDSLFFIPDFRIREKIFDIVTNTINIAKDKTIIQTRNKDDLAIKYSTTGNISEFFKKEIEDRKILEYPPFSIFIKITIRGSKSFIEKEITQLNQIIQNNIQIKDMKINIFPSRHERVSDEYAMNMIIKINKNEKNITKREKRKI